MVGITGLGGIAAYAATRRRATAAGFQVNETDTPAAEGPAAAGAVAPPSLLGLQEAQQDAASDRDARRHVNQALDTLRDMQLALLGRGANPAAGLDRAARHAPEASDPVLRTLHRAVLLRVAVEAARHRAASSM